MDERSVTRREAIKKAAMAGFLLPLVGTVRMAKADEPGTPAPEHAGLTLGLAGYTMRKLSADAAIAMLKELGITSVALYKVHLPILLSTPDVCRERAQAFRDAGIAVVGTGVVQLSGSEAVMRKAFECGKAAGLRTMTASYAKPPDRETLLLTERFVREYNIRLAFHNHGPEDGIFPSPNDVWNAVEPYDDRMGLCIDVGHSARAGVDPTEAILKYRARLYDVHIKDTTAGVGVKKDQPVGLGFGRLDIRALFAALLEIRYPYQVGLEDEVESPDTIPGIAQSFGYMRGMLSALAPNRPLT
ncbi:MAG TPA: sugar phosphate isomerase/epimerase [Opitutaceae bacterium]